ncbi:cation:proton antiporter [Peribacillus frigoritolerans]|uniref:cation:proton antiporter domain-containing protein n=1 Tax=Peribacillus TaxID=2675229 RepID=UPI002E2037DC|nr:cation:proton antiporter [Peribacillus frigoritolerans]MED3994620.1 cation:proton antiporter [Peribacillus frigoritolerans]
MIYIFSLFIIYITSGCLSKLSKILRQPAVIGSMLGGLLLGSPLCSLIPYFHPILFSSGFKDFIEIISNVGLSIYMFLIGYEFNLKEVNKPMFYKSGIIAINGMLIPLASGFLIAYLVYNYIPVKTDVHLFALYLGIAISLTAFPLLAMFIKEHQLTDTLIGRIALLSASIDDALAWCLLTILIQFISMKDMGISSGMISILVNISFVFSCLIVLRLTLKLIFTKFQYKSAYFLSIVLVLIFFLIGQSLNIHLLFLGFVLGLSVPRVLISEGVLSKTFYYLNMIVLPLFFANIGLKTNLSIIFQGKYLLPLLIIFLVATISKYGGCMITMRCLGFNWRQASAIGALLNARGTMGLIVADMGLKYSIVTMEIYSIIVIISIITSIMAIPLFNLSFSHSLKKIGLSRGML